jgi:hypothetical protein
MWDEMAQLCRQSVTLHAMRSNLLHFIWVMDAIQGVGVAGIKLATKPDSFHIFSNGTY